MILVTRATGTAGTALVEELAKRGAEARVPVRDARKAASLQRLGVEPARGSFEDVEALSGARVSPDMSELLGLEPRACENFVRDPRQASGVDPREAA